MFDEEELPSPIYFEHAPLFHLLPAATLKRYGMPMLRAGHWPFLMDTTRIDHYLPKDFEHRLAQAWAATVWRHLFPAARAQPRLLDPGGRRRGPTRATDVLRGRQGVVAHPVCYTDGTLFKGAVR